jgi:hypothetical protein
MSEIACGDFLRCRQDLNTKFVAHFAFEGIDSKIRNWEANHLEFFEDTFYDYDGSLVKHDMWFKIRRNISTNKTEAHSLKFVDPNAGPNSFMQYHETKNHEVVIKQMQNLGITLEMLQPFAKLQFQRYTDGLFYTDSCTFELDNDYYLVCGIQASSVEELSKTLKLHGVDVLKPAPSKIMEFLALNHAERLEGTSVGALMLDEDFDIGYRINTHRFASPFESLSVFKQYLQGQVAISCEGLGRSGFG